jgi:NAD(P)-dependent dehydrogenase (short-subunit alcohol dehydrogenase family)
MEFQNKTAIVTGAAVGIGKATSIQLAAGGANVVMVDMNPQTLTAAKAEVEAITSNVITVICDVTDPTAVENAVQTAVDTFGGVDILVNNAGIWRCWATFLETSVEDWKRFMDINLMGIVYFTKAALPHMLKKGYGRIVNVASVAGVYGNANMVHYSATKGAVISFTKALAKEVTGQGVTVNAVSPGTVNSSKNGDIDASTPNESTYLGRSGTGRENADLICFLASEKSSYISGQNILIDGCRKSI